MLLPGMMNPEGKNLLPQDGQLIYLSNFLAPTEAELLFSSLKEKVNWRQDKIQMYGKIHDQPRLTAWFGDAGTVYTYSKITMHPSPWLPELKTLKDKIEKHTEASFNSVLLNFYRSGDDHVSWHSDNEPELGQRPMIASLSLGGIRRFQVKHRYEKELEIITLDLEPGSLLLMSGEIQKYWLHRVAKTTKAADPRINLTFRQISSSSQPLSRN